MDIRVFGMLVNGMNTVKAQEHLNQMQSNGYPHMEEKARSSYHKHWKQRAFAHELDEKVVKTTDLRLI